MIGPIIGMAIVYSLYTEIFGDVGIIGTAILFGIGGVLGGFGEDLYKKRKPKKKKEGKKSFWDIT